MSTMVQIILLLQPPPPQLPSISPLRLLPTSSTVLPSTTKTRQTHADSALWTSSAAGFAGMAPPAWLAATSTTSTRGRPSACSA